MTSSQDSARVAPGDTLPACRLPTKDGETVILGEGSFVGMPLVLWIMGPFPDLMGAAALAEKLDTFRSVGAIPLVVASDEPGAAAVLPRDLAGQALIDRDGTIARAVGLERSGVAVLDGDSRLVSVRPGTAFEEALKDCTRIFRRTERVTVRAHAPVLILHDVLEPALCRRLVDYWQGAEEKLVNQITSDQGLEVFSADGRKRRTDVHVDDPALANALDERLTGRVMPQMRKAFGFQAATYQRLRIGCYDSAELGTFGRHRDNTTATTRYRQFAMTINLNTGEYEGGELWFPEYGRQLYSPDVGGAVVFSAALLHEALPVISGRRFGIFGFFFDAGNVVLHRQALAGHAAGTEPA